jgi:hypothetical protein
MLNMSEYVGPDTKEYGWFLGSASSLEKEVDP